MADKVTVFASFNPLDDHLDAFLDLMATMVEHTRREPGCLVYNFYTDGEGGYHLWEQYKDSAALDAHRAAEHYKTYRAQVMDMLDGRIGVLVLSAVDEV